MDFISHLNATLSRPIYLLKNNTARQYKKLVMVKILNQVIPRIMYVKDMAQRFAKLVICTLLKNVEPYDG